MKLGTTYYEKCVPHQYGSVHLEFLAENGFQHIEFSPHENLLPTKLLKSLHRQAETLKFSTAFHSPDFCDPKNYQIGFFTTSTAIKRSYEALIELISELSTTPQKHTLVIHGANMKIAELSSHEAQSVNLRFFDWIANEVEKKNLPLNICLENTCVFDEMSVTQNADQLLSFFKQMKGAPISLCFDLPHWWRQCQFEKKAPDLCFHPDYDLLFEQISYAHLHGFNQFLEKPHLRFKSEHSLFLDFVKRFSNKKTQINFNLEIFDVQGFENFDSYQTLLKSQLQHLDIL